MLDFTVITNNPLVYERFQNIIKDDIVWVNASALDVLAKVRHEIQKGAVLLSHPLSGNIQPGKNPYKSVLVSKPQPQVNFQSVKYIEDSIHAYKKNVKLKYMSYTDKVISDFQLMDLDMLASALSGMQQELK
jgi:hypothetical protein